MSDRSLKAVMVCSLATFALITICAGCTSAPAAGPTAAEEAAAEQLVWWDFYAMTPDKPLPRIAWTTGCNQDSRFPHIVGWCHSDLVTSDGIIEVAWTGSISSSYWSVAVERWHWVAMGNDLAAQDASDTNQLDEPPVLNDILRRNNL